MQVHFTEYKGRKLVFTEAGVRLIQVSLYFKSNCDNMNTPAYNAVSRCKTEHIPNIYSFLVQNVP